MKFLKSFNKEEIEDYVESFVDGLSTNATFYVHTIIDMDRYDIYINISPGIGIEEFNEKKKTFEKRINLLNYEILYKLPYGNFITQKEIIPNVSNISSILILLQKFKT